VLFGVNFDAVQISTSGGAPPASRSDAAKPVGDVSPERGGAGSGPFSRVGGETPDDRTELSKQGQEAAKGFKSQNELTDEERKKVQELKRTDQAVRAHEQTHKAVGGQYVRGGANYEYEKGPDGQMYAVGGEVKIDVSEVEGDPEATIQKMQVVRRAALAPQDPSPQDRRVAAEASRKENRARAELQAEKMREATQQAQARAENPEESEFAGVDIPGSSAAVFTIKDAESYRVDPPENLFELFA
jgi:hypothetical protein